jgi:hypothetical protein
MKIGKIILIVLAVLLTVGLINRAFNSKQIDKRNAERDSLAILEVNAPKVEKYKEFYDLVYKTEPRVKDAYITDANVFYVSVYTDGTRRDGLAEYFCQKLKDNHINKVHKVKIIQVNTQKHPDRDNAYGILLGESVCN